ncbi:MAG: tryptophan synthase subunit alpha, partial [Treponema sp.]
MSRILMAHQVAGYPDDETALAVGNALIKGGAKIIEIQLAFSDPSADGVAIQTACSEVLGRGYTVRNGFAYIRRLHKIHPEVQLFLMTYASLAYRPGIENFVRTARDAGITGFIIPDLPFDCDEGLGEACRKYNLYQIPVA